MPTSIALKISANSTRRVKWHAKLGYCREAWPFPVTLNSINGNGGLVVRMKAFVLRVYPLVYIVKQKSDGGSKTGEQQSISVLISFGKSPNHY